MKNPTTTDQLRLSNTMLKGALRGVMKGLDKKVYPKTIQNIEATLRDAEEVLEDE